MLMMLMVPGDDDRGDYDVDGADDDDDDEGC